MERDDIDHILLRRTAPPPASAGFAERIIAAAIADIAERGREKRLWAEIMGLFALPHPAIAVTVCVLLGLGLGMQAGDSLFPASQDWSSFLSINDGDWS